MIETSALAERLYETWRARQDFVAPLGDGSAGALRTRTTRPPWKLLTTLQQDVWRHVAEAAGRAMGVRA